MLNSKDIRFIFDPPSVTEAKNSLSYLLEEIERFLEEGSVLRKKHLSKRKIPSAVFEDERKPFLSVHNLNDLLSSSPEKLIRDGGFNLVLETSVTIPIIDIMNKDWEKVSKDLNGLFTGAIYQEDLISAFINSLCKSKLFNPDKKRKPGKLYTRERLTLYQEDNIRSNTVKYSVKEALAYVFNNPGAYRFFNRKTRILKGRSIIL